VIDPATLSAPLSVNSGIKTASTKNANAAFALSGPDNLHAFVALLGTQVAAGKPELQIPVRRGAPAVPGSRRGEA
jgi:hypothetical protein